VQRVSISPRPNWKAKAEALGFDWHSAPTADDPVGTYWDESAYWRLTAKEVDTLEEATAALHTMCVAATEQAISRKLLPYFGFNTATIKLIEDSWARRERDQPSIYGRMDLAFDGSGPPKLLEYNADTPTGLYEAAVVQWTWLEELFSDKDQFNSLHEGLVGAWTKQKRTLAARTGTPDAVHFTCLMPHAEDEGTLRYMMDTALEAGLSGKVIAVSDIGWSAPRHAPDSLTEGYFVDLEDLPITTLFKIVPWDWLMADTFGPQLAQSVLDGRITTIEPAWKMVMANKAILAVLWEMYPGHDNLLPAFLQSTGFAPGDTVVAKPLLGREGANVSIATLGSDGRPAGAPLASMGGDYGDEGYVYQALASLASATDERGRTHHAVFGSWLIDGVSRGIGIREDTGLITHNRSRFVPHLF
jgi:glutathionylspermidine synthase